jgi:hypothetical protein
MHRIKLMTAAVLVGFSVLAQAGFAPDADNTSYLGVPGYRYAALNVVSGNVEVLVLNGTNIGPAVAQMASAASTNWVIQQGYITNDAGATNITAGASDSYSPPTRTLTWNTNAAGGGGGGGLSAGASYTNLSGLTAVTYGSLTSLVVDAMAQNQIVMLLTNNIEMAAPTNAIPGRKIQWSLTADSSDRTVTWPTNLFRIPSSSTMSNVVTVTSNTESIFLIEYRTNAPNWKIESYVWGY